MAVEGLRFVRRFIVPDALLLAAEATVIGWPLYDCFTLDDAERRVLYGVAPVVAALAMVVWTLAMRGWRAHLAAAAKRRIAGKMLDAEERADAYRVILRLPRRALGLRVGLWSASAAAVALAMRLRAGFPVENVVTVTAMAT